MTAFPTFRRAIASLAILAALSLTAPQPADAQRLRVGDIVQADILPGWQTDRGTRMAALRLEMAPGWHTYWRNPGDSGIAPRFDWSNSQNVANIRVLWPRPEPFTQGGMTSYGYEDTVILPLEITPQDASRPMALMGDISIGVCESTCVPADLSVVHALRGAGARDRQITAALNTRPEPAARAGLGAVTCALSPAERGGTLTLRARLPRIGNDETVIVELPGTHFWVSSSQTAREGRDLVAQMQIRAPRGAPLSFDRASVVVWFLSESQLLNTQGCTGA